MRRQSNRAVPSLLTKKAIFIVPIPFNTLRHAGIRATRPTNIYIYRPRQKQNPKKLSPDGKTGETKTPCGVRNCTLRQVLEYSAASTHVLSAEHTGRPCKAQRRIGQGQTAFGACPSPDRLNTPAQSNVRVFTSAKDSTLPAATGPKRLDYGPNRTDRKNQPDNGKEVDKIC